MFNEAFMRIYSRKKLLLKYIWKRAVSHFKQTFSFIITPLPHPVVSLVPTSTRRVTRPVTQLWLTRTCFPQRVWLLTGSNTTSTGPTRVTAPSQWLRLAAAGGVSWSTLSWVNPGPSLWLRNKGESIYTERTARVCRSFLILFSPQVHVLVRLGNEAQDREGGHEWSGQTGFSIWGHRMAQRHHAGYEQPHTISSLSPRAPP